MHTLRSDERRDPATDIEICVVGGGSRGWAQTLMNDLAQTGDFSGTVLLYDVDYASAKANEKLGHHIQNLSETVGTWRYEAVETIEEGLANADFVVCSTQDPPAETFKYDLEVPQEYGIFQTVGDTVGPGGIFRTLRAVPQYRRFASAIREHCPDAWVFNYTNPMTTVTRSLYEEYPDINAIGLCHEVYSTQNWLARLVEKHLDEPAHRRDVDVTVTGINHFTWVSRARWGGQDLFAFIDEELSRNRPLPSLEPGDLADEGYFVDKFHITLDLYDRFGWLPAAGDRHLAEFVPWYLNVDEAPDVHRWGIKLTPSSHRVSGWTEGEDWRERVLSGEETFELTDSGEEMVDIMASLLGHEPTKTNVNLPNVGQAPSLPGGAVVETNALVTENKIEPLVAEAVPPGIRSLITPQIANQEMLVRAGFEGDLDKAFQAFLADRLVGTVDREVAEALFTELVSLEREYLTDYNVDSASILE